MRLYALPLAVACALSACAPDFWCADADSRLSASQKEALEAFERAARDWREAILSQRPESEDRGRVENLRRAAEDFLDAEGTSVTRADAPRYLAAWSRRWLARSASAFPDSGSRAKAALRAADAARRWAPETAPYLPPAIN